MPPERSDALMLFLGWDLSPYPKKDPQRLVDRYGESRGLDLLLHCERVMSELYESRPEWTTEDLVTATNRAVATVRENHPDFQAKRLTL
jgi:hypothetical protein